MNINIPSVTGVGSEISPMQDVLNFQDQAISQLNEISHLLAKRLAPIINVSQAEKNPGIPHKPPSENSSLVETLRDKTSLIFSVNKLLNSVYSNLEI